MGLSFTTALAASFQGQKLVADLEQEKAQTANEQAMTGYHQMQTAELQRKADGEKQMGQWMSTQFQADGQPLDSASTAAQTYAKGAQVAASKGNFDMMTKMQALATSETERAKDLRVEAANQVVQKREASAQAAIQYLANPVPENALSMAQAAVAAGVNPVTIPQPGTLEFTSWAKSQQTSALSSKDALARGEKIREFEIQQQDKTDHQKEEMALRQQMAANTAAYQQGTLVMRGQSLALERLLAEGKVEQKASAADAAREKVQFNQVAKLNDQAAKEAKPYMADRAMTQSVKGLLAENSPAADKQIQQELTSLKSGVSRATNLYYKDNKNFGDIADKIAGFASQSFTGRYSDEQRKQIFELVDGMQRRVIDPALRNLETDAKEKGKMFKLPTDSIKLAGEFNRELPKTSGTSSKGGAVVTGAIEEAPTAGALKTNTPAAAPAITLPSGWTMK